MVNHPWRLPKNEGEMEYTTLKGLTLDAAIARMKEVLPDRAYKKISGTGADLTDINPAWMLEVVTDVFGPCGIGWWYEYRDEDLGLSSEDRTSKKERNYTVWKALLRRLELSYIVLDAQGGRVVSQPIIAQGYNENEDPGWAMRGAVTNALGGAFAKLCWQIGIYKGEKDAGGKPPKAVRPYDLPTLRNLLERTASKLEGKALQGKERGLMVGVLNRIFKDSDDDRHTLLLALWGVPSSKDISESAVLATLEWLKPANGVPSPMSEKEALAAVTEFQSKN